jgi:DHA2 family multidrug resistance protein
MEGPSLRGSKLWITVAAMLASLMSVLDISIVNVALNDIRASFGSPLDQIAWVSTGYAMANITIIPISGFLQKRWGIKKYYAGSIVLFTIASALCGLAWSLPSLVVFRILQGLGGGAIIPTSQNILFSRYPREQQGTAGALFGMAAMTAPLLGPTLGGYLIDVSTWHWIFYINVPLGALAAYIAYANIDEPDFVASKAPIDTFGIGLLAVGMVSLQYVLEEGNRDGWFESSVIVALAVIAATTLITFVVHELETKNPVVDFGVFKNVSYAASTGVNFLIGTALFGGSFLFSLYCGTVMRYSALDIGLLFLKGSWIQLLIMPVVGKLIGKVDSRKMIGIGLTGVLLSLWMNGHLTPDADTHTMVMPLLVRAAALSLCFVPLSVVALADLPASQRGNAAGLFNATRELGGSIGTAWMSTHLDRMTKQYQSDLAPHFDAYSSVAHDQLRNAQAGLGARLWDPVGAALSSMQMRLDLQALVRAFNEGFTTLAVLFVASIAVVFCLKKPDSGVVIQGAH